MSDVNRVLPHNLDAECAVLGAVLIDNEALFEAQEIVTPAAFFRDAHRRIFAAMLELQRRRSVIDLVLLKEELTRTGELDEVGGAAYVSSLIDGVPHSVNVAYYARVVHEKAILRRMIYAGNKLVSLGYDASDSVDDILAGAEATLIELSREALGSDGFVFSEAWMAETYKAVEHLHEQKRFLTGLATGFPHLDRMTRGFQPGDMIILAGRPSMGKTAASLQLALTAAQYGVVPYFSIEMSRQAIGLRACALQARINSYPMMTGQLEPHELERLTAAMDEIARTGFAIDDSAKLTPHLVRSRVMRLIASAKKPLALIVIDYLGLMDTSAVKSDNRQDAIAQVSRQLKELFKELRVPGLVLSQLNRASESRSDKKPQLADLRESGALEQDADVVLLLHRPEMYEQTPRDPGLAEVIIAKQRNGPTGTIKLKFVAPQTRFEPWQGAEA